MGDLDPEENPELANIGNALDGTLDISTEDVEEVPSKDEAIAGAAALEVDGDGLLKWLKKRTKVYQVATRLNNTLQRVHTLLPRQTAHLHAANHVSSRACFAREGGIGS